MSFIVQQRLWARDLDVDVLLLYGASVYSD